MHPPTSNPPVLLSLDYATQQPVLPEDFRENAGYVDGTLHVWTSVQDGNHGIAAADLRFRDFIVQADVALAEGGADDLYGLFLRSPSSNLYYAYAVSPNGHIFISPYDGQFAPIVSGPLDPDMPFAAGLGNPNRFQVVAVGPSLTFLLNGMHITAEIVDERYEEGYLGVFVHHGSMSSRAELAASWIQIRGVFPPG